MPPELGDLSRTLTILRISRGWSQDRVAKEAGLTNSALSEYERGRKTPEFKNVRKIVAALGYRLSAIDRCEDFLQELQSESILPNEAPEPAALEAGEADEMPRPLLRRARRVASQLGQALTSTSLFLFEILISRKREG
ncbi:MAG TPA: helix-turn-helix transcriptional regulator [Thermoanaerobaculia bacterium]|nr:helix-turn-helix transcriptional regulator [Thermoanaerobaculia bacterium]